MSTQKDMLYELILDAQILTEDELNSVYKEKSITSKHIIDIVSEKGFAEKEEFFINLKATLELHFGVSFFNLQQFEPNHELLSIFPVETIINHKIIPISRSGYLFTFAMVEPDNINAEREIKYRLKDFKDVKIKKNVILLDDFIKFTEAVFPKKDENTDEVLQDADELISSMGIDLIEGKEDNFDVADLSDSGQDAPIIQIANSILGIAIKKGVSDIHIEPREKELIVRYRLDGVLTIYKSLPKKIQNALISRYKIMSELDIAEKRIPQDGRIRVKSSNKFIDFRVSTLPSKFGEKIVMRILDKSNISLGLDKIITNADTLKLVREMIERPYGIVFVTGPTGSGKTTTLYSALSERNTVDVNISTAEDPIEYDLNGITQSEVNKTIGLDFAKILKAFLRQDPDIMLVGETRDKETAKIAIEAALTGHLVFTTLHTNDAPSSIMRLREMDVEPFLISSSMIGVIAQRLLRRVCGNCKEAYEAENSLLKYLGIDKIGNKTYYKGKGCDKCSGSGYKGRVGAYEVMKINDHIKDLISRGANSAVIRFAAQQHGMRTLLEYSLELAKEGYTTLDEVIRVTFTSDGVNSACPSCGKPVGEEFHQCPFCQFELKKTCPRCDVLIEDGWISCAKCGFKLSDKSTESHCNYCNGGISLDMTQCPWCFNSLKEFGFKNNLDMETSE
ncbi:MAG: ATPase, T2SS/T4P/T4SS family [bacterium]